MYFLSLITFAPKGDFTLHLRDHRVIISVRTVVYL